MFGEDDLVLRAGIGLAQEGDDLVRPDTADDAGGVQTMHLGYGIAQGAWSVDG